MCSSFPKLPTSDKQSNILRLISLIFKEHFFKRDGYFHSREDLVFCWWENPFPNFLLPTGIIWHDRWPLDLFYIWWRCDSPFSFYTTLLSDRGIWEVSWCILVIHFLCNLFPVFFTQMLYMTKDNIEMLQHEKYLSTYTL